MADHQILSPKPKVSFTSDSPTVSFSSQSSSHPNPFSISRTIWLKGEKIAQEIISRVRPTVESDRRRNAITEYIQKIIRGCFGCEAFAFGSVPLKTYLPDGDVDVSAFCSDNMLQDLANYVHAFLEQEEETDFADFEVRSVQHVDAEVKLIRCIVEDISVDISFNQFGGLCKLCFLEKVDHLIGNDHLFKRSVILIKSWCYYESRILGAHHGLLSSYALETLVLCIFQLFHSSLSGPLEVLHMFLNYYGKFDWDNYCISLRGPIHISSLSEIMTEKPQSVEDGLLISSQYLRNCVELFSVPQKASETKEFFSRHLNIIDPLKENNNLGRRVTEANFYRIRGAFSQGARELGQILLLSEEKITDRICIYFSHILRRHAKLDVQDHIFSGSLAESRFDPNSFLPESIGHRRKSTLASELCPAVVEELAGNLESMNTEVGISLGSHETSNSLSDLNGDHETHFRNLLQCRSYLDDTFTPLLHIDPRYSSQLWSTESSFTPNSSLLSEENMIPNVNANNFVLGPNHSPVKFPWLAPFSFSGVEPKTRRGLGTFFSKTNMDSNRDKPLSERESNRDKPSSRRGGNSTMMNSSFLQSPKAGAPVAFSGTKNSERRAQVCSEFDVTSSSVHSTHLEFFQAGESYVSSTPHSDHLFLSQESESGSFWVHPPTSPSLQKSGSPTGTSPDSWLSLSPTTHKPAAESNVYSERVVKPSFHIEDKNDFPPLPLAVPSPEVGRTLDSNAQAGESRIWFAPLHNEDLTPPQEIEPASHGILPLPSLLPQVSKSPAETSQGSALSLPQEMQNPTLESSMNSERVVGHLFHIEDENVFPSLPMCYKR